MTAAPVKERDAMIRQMDPVLTAGSFAFVTFDGEPPDGMAAAAVGMFREAEGISLIVPSAHAPGAPAMRLITLNVHSALDGVGLTAAVSGALADAGIPANIVAAYHHDHVFLPEDKAETALAILRRLSNASGTK